eukprot:2289771-Prorocentrum_lima.AAC.1
MEGVWASALAQATLAHSLATGGESECRGGVAILVPQPGRIRDIKEHVQGHMLSVTLEGSGDGEPPTYTSLYLPPTHDEE